MPHINELDGFDAACRDYLRELYPDAELGYQVYLPDSRRRCDFVVTRQTPGDAPNVVYTVETEDTFDGVIASIGQAEMYAGHFERGSPVVLYPEGHYQQPELACLRSHSPALLLEVPASYEPGGQHSTATATTSADAEAETETDASGGEE